MKVLVITSNFRQEGVPSSHHIDDRLIELVKYGMDITVITENYPKHIGSDLSGKVKVAIAGKNLLIYNKIKNKIDFIFNKIGYKIKLHKDRFANWNWEQYATQFISKKINVAQYDLIYSTGGPAVAHLVAYNIAKSFKIKWIAEIQDPLIFEEITGPSYQASQNDLEKLSLAESALKESNALICLTQDCMKHYQKKLDKAEVFYVYPGSHLEILSKDKWNKTENNHEHKIVFFYAGTLAAERNLDIFINAVKLLNIQDKIILKIAGYIDESVKKSIRDHSNFINYLGSVSRTEVIKNILDSDICLVVQNLGSVSALTIPSKFYEYVGLGAPVFFLGYKNREMEANSEYYNFYYADQSSREEVMETLSSIIKEHGRYKKNPIPVKIKDSTNKFLEILKKV